MAEYGWGLPDELVQKARRELNELPETREQAIQAVREQIHTRQDISEFSGVYSSKRDCL